MTAIMYAINFAARSEQEPRSRFLFGSPCRYIRRLDLAIHVVLPELIAGPLPIWACYLRTTSPRWGRSWRSW